MSVGTGLSGIATVHEPETGTLLIYHQNNHRGIFVYTIRM